ncbi:MAG: hypothetical protein J2P40_10510 [Candidatus Dormibacteraeota bacterium]|nr:hypothetical protein [Candidatus Dormibacteraeota bacterium]MBO0761693.1 hypothetical protein [Candidatus Dormibacteraeota bacterium]
MSHPADGGGGSRSPKIDVGLAHAAQAEATAALRLLKMQTPERIKLGHKALQRWQGPHADQFRPRLSDTQSQATTLAGQLQSLIRQLQHAIDEAGSGGS